MLKRYYIKEIVRKKKKKSCKTAYEPSQNIK